MIMKSMKTLRTEAQQVLDDKVDTKAKLYDALPKLISLQDAITAANTAAKKIAALKKELSEACVKYAVEHPSVFEGGRLIENQSGVLVGDIVIDDVTYHLACGFEGYERSNGSNLSQPFLATLPDGWTKTKLELSTTGINAAKPSEEKLAELGLVEKPNNKWSRKD